MDLTFKAIQNMSYVSHVEFLVFFDTRVDSPRRRSRLEGNSDRDERDKDGGEHLDKLALILAPNQIEVYDIVVCQQRERNPDLTIRLGELFNKSNHEVNLTILC